MNRRLPKAFEVVSEPIAALLRSKTAAERARMASDMHDAALVVVERVIRHEHPEWTDEAVRSEMRRRFLGEAA